MNNDEKNKMVPKLRFPEFKTDGEWKEKSLGNACVSFSGGTPATTNKEFYGGDIPFIRSAEINKETTELFLTEKGLINSSAKIINKGDILIALYGANSGDVALAKINGAINQAILCLKSEESNAFIYQYLSLKKSLIVSTYIQGGQGNLSGEIIKSIKLLFPIHKEQQKIADCLSSLDDLITAENQKLEALKAHKKGLMQQLFPAEGETLPKLRFEEFRDSGEWEEKTLGQVGDVLMCKRIFAEETNPSKGIPFFKIGTLGGKPDAYISRELFNNYKSKYNYPRKGEILITCSGTVGKTIVYNGEDAYYQDSNIVWIDNPKLEVSNELLFHLLSKVNWDILNSTTITRIYNSDLRALKLLFPNNKSEQVMIADCLSSCDVLIKSQAEKIKELNNHKKGLMQGLFPENS